jgi:hypothetical protein
MLLLGESHFTFFDLHLHLFRMGYATGHSYTSLGPLSLLVSL